MALRPLAVDHADPSRVEAAIAKGRAWLEGMQSSDGGWGAFDVDNTRALVRDLPFCDFGEVIDPPQRRRHRARRRDARRARPRRRGGAAARRPLAAGRPGDRRLVVRALGRQPRLRDRRRRARARRRRRVRSRRADPARRAAGWSGSRTTTAAGARTAAPTTTRPGSAAARAPPRRPRGRCWRCTPPASGSTLGASAAASTGWPRPSVRTAAGTSRSHRHRLPVGLLHQLPPVPAGVPGDGARDDVCDEHGRAPRRRARRPSGPRRGDGPGRRGELHGRQRAARPPRPQRHLRRSTGSRGWSTTSATRRPATGWRCWTSSPTSSARIYDGRPQPPGDGRAAAAPCWPAGCRPGRSSA